MAKRRDRTGVFVKWLQAEMKRQEISGRALSEACGQHKNYINEVIHRQHRITLDEFIDIVSAINASPPDVLRAILEN